MTAVIKISFLPLMKSQRLVECKNSISFQVSNIKFSSASKNI